MKCESLPSLLCATWLAHKHAHSESTDVWLLREDVCQPTCFVPSNNDERAWALLASTVQAVIVRSTRSLANVCVGAVREDEAG